MKASQPVLSRRPDITLLVILLIAAALRLFGLEVQSLWNDELSSLFRSSHKSLSEVIDLGVRSDIHPPGYQVLLYFVVHFIGDSPTVIRLPSALAGIAAVYTIYLVGLRLYGRHEGLAAAALLAVAKCPIYFSQEARAYSLLLLFSLLSTYFWLALAGIGRTSGRKLRWEAVGYVCSAAPLCYFHYYGLFLVALQLSFGVLYRAFARDAKRAAVLAACGAGVILCWLPWLRETLLDFREGKAWFGRPELDAVRMFVNYCAFLISESATMTWYALGLAGTLLLLTVISFLPARFFPRVMRNIVQGERDVAGSTLFLLGWLVVPFLISYVRSITGPSSVLAFKSLLISLPAFYILVARALVAFIPAGRPWLRLSPAALISAGLLWHLLFVYKYYSTVQKEQWREAAATIIASSEASPGVPVIAVVHTGEYLDYYLKRQGEHNVRVEAFKSRNDVPRLSELLGRTDVGSRVWVVHINAEIAPELSALLNTRLRAIRAENGHNTHVVLYEVLASSFSTLTANHVVPGISFDVVTGTRTSIRGGYARTVTVPGSMRAAVQLSGNVSRVTLRVRPAPARTTVLLTVTIGDAAGKSHVLLDKFSLSRAQQIELPFAAGSGAQELRVDFEAERGEGTASSVELESAIFH